MNSTKSVIDLLQEQKNKCDIILKCSDSNKIVMYIIISFKMFFRNTIAAKSLIAAFIAMLV